MSQLMRKVAYWIAFALCQVTGFVVLSLLTFHSKIAPLFLWWLLLPSSILLPLAPEMPMFLLIFLTVLLDFAAWFVFYRWGSLELIRGYTENDS
jgi:hypothetical protein